MRPDPRHYEVAMDVVDLRDFYATGLGRLARRLIRRRVRQVWPDLRGERVLGLGYATPYLQPLRDQAERSIALMPAPQGVLHWPEGQRGLVALAEDGELPLPDLSMDRVILVHALEFSEQTRPLLREVWRLMSDRGRLLIVAPNRRGLWARFDNTPFGQGHPYTARQLQTLLRDTMFTPLRTAGALYGLPLRSAMALSVARAWEGMAEPWMDGVAGVVIVEAAKQIYAAELAPERRVRRRQYAPVSLGSAEPRPG
jgi:SAM-dependent methyltransferase